MGARQGGVVAEAGRRSPEAEEARKAENERIYALRSERAAKARTEPATDAQVKYLTTLAEKVGKE
ncbi:MULTISPECIES: hypothetical protein [unclassified Embleya]|uniref:hypothetical protein n=1 Tax=unclassified Embleya TaxID=2699296 RepID=UPI0033D1BD03